MPKVVLALILTLCALDPLFCAQPQWLSNAYYNLDRHETIASLGSGRTRAEAENSATANLAAVFGQSVSSAIAVRSSESRVDSQVSTSDWMTSAASTVSVIDNIVGIEVVDYYENAGNHFARAVLDIEITAAYYESLIDSLTLYLQTTMTVMESTAADFFLYLEAKDLYGNLEERELAKSILSVLWPNSSRLADDGLRHKLDTLCSRIRENISFALDIGEDVNGSLEDALSAYLTRMTIPVSEGNARYIFTGDVFTYEYTGARNNVYVDYEIDLELYDNMAGMTVFTCHSEGRKGQRTAERALRLISSSMEEIVLEMLGESFSSIK